MDEEIRYALQTQENTREYLLRVAAVRLPNGAEYLVAYGGTRGSQDAVLGAWEPARLQRFAQVLFDVDATIWKHLRESISYRYGHQIGLPGV